MEVFDLTDSPPAKRQKRGEVIDLCTPEASPSKELIPKVTPSDQDEEDKELQKYKAKKQDKKEKKVEVTMEENFTNSSSIEDQAEVQKREKITKYKKRLLVIPEAMCVLCSAPLGKGVSAKASSLGKEYISCTSVSCKYFRFVKR